MDGGLCAIALSGSLVVGGAIIGGFWRVLVKISDQNTAIGNLKTAVGDKIGEQNVAIGRLEGKVDGMGDRILGYEKQIGGLDKRIDSFINHHRNKG